LFIASLLLPQQRPSDASIAIVKFFLTTAIDYPNSRPHIGTAFEKIGADVQARWRRMQGRDVFLLMGNDENTVKVSRRAAELGKETKAYCDEMAGQFREVWDALDIQYDDFVQTSERRHHRCAQAFIQKVYDNGYIEKGSYEGWYCDGCESFKTDTEVKDAGGLCPIHKTPVIRRTEPCYFFKQSAFQDRVLKFLEENPDFVQPESRRNEILEYVKSGLKDVNITRRGESWGIKVPFDPEFTIWVWFDALLTYFTGIGYGTDDAKFAKYWPADVHFIGKDITRFHCALWPCMLWAAGLEAPKRVFGHGFVYIKDDTTGALEKISKSLGNVVDPMDLVTKFSSDAFRYYFMRECPFPGDGDFSWQRFTDVFNADLANKIGNLYSRVVTLITKNFGGAIEGPVALTETQPALADVVRQIEEHLEYCRYNQALEAIVQQVTVPANQYADKTEPWKVVKVDKNATKPMLATLAEQLRRIAILAKPFLPRSMETIYRSFNFAPDWKDVAYSDVVRTAPTGDLRFVGQLEDGKPKPLFPRIR
jgi:methionyl-tRNA synthetase